MDAHAQPGRSITNGFPTLAAHAKGDVARRKGRTRVLADLEPPGEVELFARRRAATSHEARGLAL